MRNSMQDLKFRQLCIRFNIKCCDFNNPKLMANIFAHSTKSLAEEFFHMIIPNIKAYMTTYFSTLIPNHPSGRRIKMQLCGVIGEILAFSGHVTSAWLNRRKVFISWLGQGLGSG